MTGYTPHLILLLIVAALFVWQHFFPKSLEKLEDSLLVLIMSILTLVAFGQVVARYGFNSGWTGALEFSMVCFSWLILIGMSYCIKRNSHLGVDILIKIMPKPIAKWMAIFGAFTGLLYGLIILDASWLQSVGIDTRSGAIDYWAKMYKINIGTEELRWPVFIQDFFGVKDRVQRWLVLTILPISLALICFRSLEAMIEIYQGKRAMIIAGHEAEELVTENKGKLEG